MIDIVEVVDASEKQSDEHEGSVKTKARARGKSSEAEMTDLAAKDLC